MADISLDQFITTETKRLLNFASAWRYSMGEKPDKFPSSATSESYWLRQYFAYTAKTVEEEKRENDKKAA